MLALTRLKQDKRAVSNVIVAMLSLVLVTIVVSNVILWSYQMNDLDLQRMHEALRITEVAPANNSSWFTAQNEYATDVGIRAYGTYRDTQSIDGAYESFTEGLNWWNTNYTYRKRMTVVNNGSSTMSANYSVDVTLDTNSLIGSGKLVTSANDLRVAFWSGSNWTELDRDVNDTNTASTQVWFETQAAILASSSDSNYYLYYGNPDAGSPPVNIIRTMTGVEPWISLDPEETQVNRLEIDGVFAIDLSTYPLNRIRTVEVQMMYRSSDPGEKWYIKAYNWTSSTYSDNGFNSSAGDLPSTGWNYYTLNFTGEFSSYVNTDGTVCIKILDYGVDANKTTIDIDFLAIRAAINGTVFTFENSGSITAHIVALWINNSTQHQRYEVNLYINSADTVSYTDLDVNLSEEPYRVKAVTERGNIVPQD